MNERGWGVLLIKQFLKSYKKNTYQVHVISVNAFKYFCLMPDKKFKKQVREMQHK